MTNDLKKSQLKMIQLNQIEKTFLDLKCDLIDISGFEKWVYQNETEIIKNYSNSIYEELIILDYNNKHSKFRIPKILDINLEKLKKYEFQNILISILSLEKILINEVAYNKYNSVDDTYHRNSFQFKIEKFTISMHNPFDFKNIFSIDTSNEDIQTEIKKRFKSPRNFFQLLLNELNTINLKLVVMGNLDIQDWQSYIKAVSGEKDDLIIARMIR